jgi:hypothetical protein
MIVTLPLRYTHEKTYIVSYVVASLATEILIPVSTRPPKVDRFMMSNVSRTDVMTGDLMLAMHG